MSDSLFATFTTLVAVIGPIDVATVFAAMTASMSTHDQRSIAWRAVLVATIILLLFAFTGQALLNQLGVSLAAFRTAGGILLLLVGIEMVFGKNPDVTASRMTASEKRQMINDMAVFPLASPLIAGPGAMGAVMLWMAKAEGRIEQQLTVTACLLSVLLLTLLALLLAGQIQRHITPTAGQVITKVFGLLITAMAVQFIFEGIAESGLL